MLVLSRKTGEKLFLELEDGRVIEVVLVSVDRGKVRVGVNAPRTIRVEREEIRQNRLNNKD